MYINSLGVPIPILSSHVAQPFLSVVGLLSVKGGDMVVKVNDANRATKIFHV